MNLPIPRSVLRPILQYAAKIRRRVRTVSGWLPATLLRSLLAFVALVSMAQAQAQINNAAYVSQSVPTTMIIGQRYNVSVTMRNNGTTAWAVGTDHRLGSQNPTDNLTWGLGRVLLNRLVAPGEQHTFNFSVTAPAAVGTYNFQWGMLREYVAWFGAPSTNVGITVSSSATPLSPIAEVTYFHNDASGTPMLATSAAGSVLWKETYRPYGERVKRSAASANNALWFAGMPHDDNTGLSYAGARYYDPLLGRFVGVDPADFDPENVHSFNRYAYANNNPYKFVDPDGHSPLDVAFLLYDVGKLGVAMYTGVGVGPALLDVGASLIGVASPVPFAGQAIKAARAVDKGADISRAAAHSAEAAGSVGRAGRQVRLRELAADDKLSRADRGWIKQEMNAIDRGKRKAGTIRNPPGKDLAHERGREAAKGYSYKHSNLQGKDLHALQHKHDDFGRANNERAVEQPPMDLNRLDRWRHQ